ncbi:MAG: caspase family protein [Cyanobacteria bacterium J06627_32]
MARNLYALLVGINEYDSRSRVPSLRGCVNDIQGIQAYLEGRVAQADFNLNLQVLLNEQATRQAIIEGFQQHLARANAEDVVLFYYAGHGAQADAPEAFWPVSPDRMMETLVCYDSRIDDDHWDLADKELAQLIATVDANEPHIAVVLDCCHSGSGTREAEVTIATRRAEPDRRQRPLESFIVSPAAGQETSGLSATPDSPATGTRSLSPMAAVLPSGRHVVLSACRNVEEAKEYLGGESPRGAFSYFLQASLAKANGPLSYRDLFKRTNALIRSGVPSQSPQLDATHSEDLERPFLGGAIAPSPPYFTVSYNADHGWVIDGGAIHGLQPPAGDEATTLAVYSFDADAEQLKTVSTALAQVDIAQVMPQLSKISASGEPFSETGNTFKAVVISSPLPPLQVFLEGNMVGVESLRRAIAAAGPSGQSSLYVQAIDQVEGAAFRVLAEDDTYTITSPTDKRPLVAPVGGYDNPSATQVTQNLEHIARWKTIAELSSPASSQIQGAVSLKIYTGEEASPEAATEIQSAQIRLDYRYSETKQTWAPPRFRIKLHNTSNQTLFCAIFFLTERFKAAVLKPDGIASLVRLLPDQEIWFANGAALKGTVADALWQQGITESRDILKLIACTDEFDPLLMELGELGLPLAQTRSVGAGGGSLNRLMQRVNTRDIGFADEAPTYDDWVANQIAFTFVRPQPSTPINQAETISVGANVRVAPHSALSANARLTTVPQSTRDLGGAILPPLLQSETVPFQFTQSRASDPGLSALELSNVGNLEAVTPEQPLLIEADMPLGEGEYVLPVAYDGEFYLPLGYGKEKDGKTQIVIERLAEPMSVGTRSVTGSIRIFFQKIIAKKLEREFEYPLLAATTLERPPSSGGKAKPKVVYVRDVERVKAQVASAQNIAIYIHGIFGDTASILPSLDTAIATLGDGPTPIGQLYDLVLAFDYENLNTAIDSNARLLKARLEAVGLGVGHGKTLHIIAHSMGGLVSRWFIEREGGKDIVSHLIMLGTPNNGSPWPQVQAGITAAVSFALNSLSLVAAPLKILEALLTRIETVDVSLDQMQPGSAFLSELAESPDPGVPYTLVVGNTSLVEQDARAGLRQKLMQRLGKLVEMPFFNRPNDIAVLVDSIVYVPADRTPAPRQLPTACNHLEYFVHPAGLASLTEAVVGTGIVGTGTVGTGTVGTGTGGAGTVGTGTVAAGALDAGTVSRGLADSTGAVDVGALDGAVQPVGDLPAEAATSTAAEPQLPGFAPLPPVPVEDDEPSPFLEERTGADVQRAGASSGVFSKVWVWAAIAAVLGALLSLVWAQRDRSVPAEPVPESSLVDPDAKYERPS